MSNVEQAYLFWSMDTPAGPFMVAQCVHPESNRERPDVPQGQCPVHARTVYWCLDQGEYWCDGGAPDYDWHELELVAVSYKPEC